MSSSCGICGILVNSNDVNDQIVKCAGSCEISFHSRCIQDDVKGAKTRSFRDWRCKKCRNAADSDPVPKMNVSEDLIRGLEDFKLQVLSELKTTRTELNALSESMQFFSNQMDENTNLMKEIKSEVAAVKKENENLRSMNVTLTNEVTSLKDRVRSLEQYSRKNNVEIVGIPETPKENAIALVKDVGTALGLEIQEADISTAHRVPSFRKDRPPALIAQFSRRTARDSLLSRFREKKVMTAKQVNTAFPTQNVYINEHLSPENKQFLSKLKQKCKDVGYDYAWCRDGRFFVRKCQGERYRRVDTYDELDKLK